MRLYLLILSLITFLQLAHSATENLDIRDYESADTCRLDIPQVRVKVTGVEAKGILTVELYNDPGNFLNKKGRLRRVRVAAESNEQQVCFNINSGMELAVAAYHDVDGNRKLKKRWNMMPKEPFGLSKNPKLKLGFPKFRNSAFITGQAGSDITIHLQKP